jgi:hypothetical protein
MQHTQCAACSAQRFGTWRGSIAAMTEITTFQVARDDLSKTRFVSESIGALQPGEVLLKVDSFAFTANNITYAETGVVLKYWQFFPAPEGWGVIPVWGFADVVESRHDALAPGERLFGYWPMATHAVLMPDRVDAGTVVDGTPHRRELPVTYNIYQRTSGTGPLYDKRYEDMQSIFVPLFGTAFLLDDFLAEQKFFGAKAVVIASASAKTGFSLAHLLHQRGEIETVGLTSSGNRAFVEGLGCYDRVLMYDEIGKLPTRPAVLVDFAGNGKVRVAVHEHLGDNLKYSCAVGMSHRDLHPPGKGLPGPKPVFFFAPEYRRQRIEALGRDAYNAHFGKTWNAFLPSAGRWLKATRSSGRDAVERVYLDTLNGKVSPDRGNILSL